MPKDQNHMELSKTLNLNNNNSSEEEIEYFLQTLVMKNNVFVELDLTKLSSLNLSHCMLSYLPNALKILPLRNFNLSFNLFSEIPDCLYLGLDEIENLNLSDNKIEKFEVEPNCREKLEILNLSNNKFKNIPLWIMNIRSPHLKEICYDFNKITFLRCIYDNTKKFPVCKLSLKNCILRDEDLKFLKACDELIYLDISNTEKKLFSNVLTEIEKLFVQPSWKNMQILKLNNLNISMFPESLTWLESLTELYASNNFFMWLPKDGFEYFVNLEILDLSHNLITAIPEKLTWLYLKVLNLSYNKIDTLPDLSRMKFLEVLDLYYNRLCSIDFVINDLNLKYLDLEMNHFNTKLCNIKNYEIKKEEFRKIIEDERFDGDRDETIFYDYDKDIDEIDPEENPSVSKSSSISSEDWDEEIKLYHRNEDVTTSDEEWKGFEENFVERKKSEVSVRTLNYNEDVIFCDAD